MVSHCCEPTAASSTPTIRCAGSRHAAMDSASPTQLNLRNRKRAADWIAPSPPSNKVGEHFFDGHATDFLAPRRGDLPAYIVSVRPLVCGQTRSTFHADAEIMLLLRDPLCRNVAVSQILQELFSLTNAEADLAQALCTGKTTTAYASERRVTLNTVYSHLKRIREKTGCKSVPGLIRKFAELDVPLRTQR